MSTPTRRTIAQGAAWAVPVIAVGAAVPMSAASVPPITVELDADLSCKFPGKSDDCFPYGYRLAFRINSNVDITLAISQVSAPGGTKVTILDGGGTVSVLGGVEKIVVVTIGSTDSANGTAVVTLIEDGVAITRTITISNFHPCDGPLKKFCP